MIHPSGTHQAMDDAWSIGVQPVDLKRRPLTDKNKRGGWKASAFIVGSEVAERMAYFGIAANFIMYLVYKYHFTFPDAATVITNVLGTSCLTPLIGAFLADAYLGRYWTITVFSFIYLLGLVMLTITASVPSSLLPPSTGCGELQLYLGSCTKASHGQLTFLYASLYVLALGSGGIRPCVAAFGADQFDPVKDASSLAAFFNVFYFAITLGAVASLTIVVYVQDYISWASGLGLLAGAMLVATAVFLVATPLYRHRIPSGSPLTRLTQVVVAAARKRRLSLPTDESSLFEVPGTLSDIPGSRKIKHSRGLDVLDRAAVVDEAEATVLAESKGGRTVSRWRLCTVSQVEELKALLRLLPVWATGVVVPNTVFIQLLNFSVQQGLTMDRRIIDSLPPIPAASIPVFAALLAAAALPLYARVLVPVARRLTGRRRGITLLQRIGCGLALSAAAGVAAAAVERRRRVTALAAGGSLLQPIDMSALWLVPQYGLVGLAEVFAMVGALEFFYDQAPDSLRSVGSSFFSTGAAVGSYLASLLATAVKRLSLRGGGRQWLDDNINDGRLDRYYWLLAGLSFLNLAAFVAAAVCYQYRDLGNGGDVASNTVVERHNNPLFDSRPDLEQQQRNMSDRSMELVKLVTNGQ